MIGPRTRSVATATLLLVFALGAMSSSAGAGEKTVDSGLRGTITRTGRCGPGSEPLSWSCTTYPYKATVRVLRARDRHEVKRFTSRARDGHYRVRLKAGRYILDPLERDGAYFPDEVRVRVHKHEFRRRDLTYISNTE